MRARSVMRRSRSAAWGGAVVTVLLTLLMHVLACSHGLTAAPAQRAGIPWQTSPTACGQHISAKASDRANTAGSSTPSPDHDAHCCELDEPAAQPPRDLGLTNAPLPAVLPAGPAVAEPVVPPPALRRSPASFPAPSAGHTRALLGMWRT
ncbi:hypothetical protein ABT273_08745 [Streptomyces humidus]|uniref:hypothetical protein n=1 Tax=Streptomyces humidus TaxID=52259 RepID=UPI00331C3CF5